eukprot:m.524834 g.524834  ORF g.524834 m.524834 type:complete len:65 (-) comp21992_c1_seq1:29-223(-)
MFFVRFERGTCIVSVLYVCAIVLSDRCSVDSIVPRTLHFNTVALTLLYVWVYGCVLCVCGCMDA